MKDNSQENEMFGLCTQEWQNYVKAGKYYFYVNIVLKW